MAKKLAVLATHGMGTGSDKFDDAILAYLKKNVDPTIWPDVAWVPVVWEDVLDDRQNKLADRLKKTGHDWSKLRGFVIEYLSDVAAYQFYGMGNRARYKKSAYYQINRKFYEALEASRKLGDIDDDTHFIGISSSLGCHILSNYMWDMTHDTSRVVDGRDRLDEVHCVKKIAGLYFAGCNIPILNMGFEGADHIPIQFPGSKKARDVKSEWLNIYDPDDVLGYPLRHHYQGYYNGLSQTKSKKVTRVKDVKINSGGLLSWSPMSHTAYWKDRDYQSRLKKGIEKIYKSLP